jgi:hypothetical protein
MTRAIVLALTVGLLTFFLCGILTAPGRDAEHPDSGIVRDAAQRYLGVDQVTILQYMGHGGAGDGIWWARIRIKGTPTKSPASQLGAFARKRGWTYSERADRAFAGLESTRPSWWTAETELHSARLSGDGAGFFAAPAGTAEEWNIMEYSR